MDTLTVRRSALVYTGISLFVALCFLLLASVTGPYSAVARFGGAAWVFLLTMIVTMPLVTARMKGTGHPPR
jgi:hypothetical protein